METPTPSGKSRLQLAIETPVEALTEAQKQLLRDSVDALSEAECERFASVLEESEE